MNNEIKQPESDTHDAFLFYRSFYQSIEVLSNKKRLKAYDMICRYGILNEIPDMNDPAFSKEFKILFSITKPLIDSNHKNYKLRVQNGMKGKQFGIQGAVHGSKGGRPRKEMNQNGINDFEEILNNLEFDE